MRRFNGLKKILFLASVLLLPALSFAQGRCDGVYDQVRESCRAEKAQRCGEARQMAHRACDPRGERSRCGYYRERATSICEAKSHCTDRAERAADRCRAERRRNHDGYSHRR